MPKVRKSAPLYADTLSRKHPPGDVFRSFEGIADAGLTASDLRAMFGWESNSSIYSAMERHAFPQPFKIGRSARWSLREVREWLEKCKAARSATKEAA